MNLETCYIPFEIDLEKMFDIIEKQTEGHKPDGRPIKWIKGGSLLEQNSRQIKM